VSTDANGVATYNMTSPIVSGGATEPLRVLNPTHPAAGVAHNFLIALPVELGEGSQFGDAISTLESLNAQNEYNLTIIEPSFAIDPWYADSATDPTELMDKFMTDQLVPWIKANLETTGTEQVWLIGFSKSGVGAQDLILRHPSVYTLAASWDFPVSASYDEFGASEETGYGTNANFVANYELSQAFVDTYAAPFTAHKRIWLGGYSLYEPDVYNVYGPQLTNAGVHYDIGAPSQLEHNWGSGWVAGALAALYQDSINLTA
jgi:S-formylglutathione hydrolase FrmB